MKKRILILVLLILATASNNIKAVCMPLSTEWMCDCETNVDCINKGNCDSSAVCDPNGKCKSSEKGNYCKNE